MAAEALTQSKINKLQPADKIIRYWDKGAGGIPCLYLMIRPSGRRTWYISYTSPVDNKTKQIKIADGATTLKAARETAMKLLAQKAIGEEKDIKKLVKPKAEPEIEIKNPTLREIRDKYAEYLQPAYGLAPNRSHKHILHSISRFSALFPLRFNDIDKKMITDCIETYRQKGLKGASINEYMSRLIAMINWAKREGLIEEDYQFPRIAKQATTDSDVKTRYLSPEERKRLYAALEAREQKQGKDYLKTAVTIANHTGIRCGALLGLCWGDITSQPDGGQTIHISPRLAKSKKSYDLPLSVVAKKALEVWREYSEQTWGPIKPEDHVIRRGKQGTPVAYTSIMRDWKRLLKEAKIENFRWHDLRHDFASQLVMAGVELYTVQRLMTHETIRMTQRYAHLSPENLKKALSKIDGLLPN
ncbi:MAG: tyrosine-type recombinase/integrase [Synergistaceae bacterium]|nr:tyrosine-type recombinase/integrase [Synergistaceae bacterium]